MGLLDINNFKIRIKPLNEMGFSMSYWGSPDWWTEYKNNSLYVRARRIHTGFQKPHWYPSKKFYEKYDEDNEIVYYYFPKGFEGYVNWSALDLKNITHDFTKNPLIVAYSDEDRWDAIVRVPKSMIDFETIVMEAEKMEEEYWKEYNL